MGSFPFSLIYTQPEKDNAIEWGLAYTFANYGVYPSGELSARY